MFSFNVFFNLFYFSLAFLSFLDFLERKSAKNFAHYDKSCLALLAVRLPGNSASQYREKL